MKIYLFNPVTGAYLGEAFADEAPFRRGEYVIPDDATTIPPPPLEPGQVPLFKVREQRWEVITSPGRAASRLRDTLEYEV
jgi:hypothetical protein